MGLSKQEPSKSAINRAGKSLAKGNIQGKDRDEALCLINLWRKEHIDPLNQVMQMVDSVRQQSKCSGSTILVGRLKRIDTIINKLSRPGNTSTVTTLQDIAGCRLVVESNDDVQRVTSGIRERVPEIRERVPDIKISDYIDKPKNSGYRGVHIVFPSCKPNRYSGLKVELQVRSREQHYWATAVETYDQASGKPSSKHVKFGLGSEEEIRFFQITSTLLHDSGTDNSALREELRILNNELNVLPILKASTQSIFSFSCEPSPDNRAMDSDIHREPLKPHSDGIYLIKSSLELQQIESKYFPPIQAQEAVLAYIEAETKVENSESSSYLLAKASSTNELKSAYSNYYMTGNDFVSWLEEILSPPKAKPT